MSQITAVGFLMFSRRRDRPERVSESIKLVFTDLARILVRIHTRM